MKLLNKTNKGFTLVEVLVVIAIIGVLSAIAVPTILTAQRESRNVTRLKELEGVTATLNQYWTLYPVKEPAIFTDATCKTLLTSNSADVNPVNEDRTYFVCANDGSNPQHRFSPTVTSNYVLKLSDTSCAAGQQSVDKTIWFYVDASGGSVVFCKEGGGSQELAYKKA